MQATIISDTSCLIILDKIGELNLLQKLFGEILTTETVQEEFGDNLPDWVLVRNPSDLKSLAILTASLDRGEASAIALALEQEECLLVIDEVKGRKMAQQLSLQITGTLGIIVLAKQKGYNASVKSVLEKIKATNFRISEQLARAVLEQAGE